LVAWWAKEGSPMMEERSARMMELKRRFEEWRGGKHRRGSKIPEELWAAATELARVEGVYPTARALRLEYVRLKARCEGSPGRFTDGPAFVALAVDGGEVAEVGTAGKPRMVIELSGRHGDRMRLEVEGPGAVDVLAMARMLWNGAS
jgi:hypothetical protein